MYFQAKTLDDLMNDIIRKLLSLPFDIGTTRGDTGLGKSSELRGVMLEIENPRARLSRTETKGTPFSAIGELIWYLTGSNEMSPIYYYIEKYERETEDGKTIYGAYGPRLLNAHGKYNQIDNVITLLKAKPTSRKAVVQLFDAADIAMPHKEIPCTCTMQFMIRDELLHMVTYMRSNDAFIGLPHDVFTFTMLQEIIANKLSVGLGKYSHSVGSLHLYEANKRKADIYLNEGYQTTLLTMPPMPKGDPERFIIELINAERKIRNGYALPADFTTGQSYWDDLVRLLQVFSIKKKRTKDTMALDKLKEEMDSYVYNTYIDKIIDSIESN